MGVIGTAVLTACGAGIISCIIGAAAPEGAEKRILKLMISIIVMICLLRPIAGFGNDDILNIYREQITGSEAGDPGDGLRGYDIRAAEISVKLELEKLLREEGIGFTETVIKCSVDEYDVITIDSAEITAAGREDRDRILELSKERLKDVPLTVKVAEDDDTKGSKGEAE